jgi:hypothetical protein
MTIQKTGIVNGKRNGLDVKRLIYMTLQKSILQVHGWKGTIVPVVVEHGEMNGREIFIRKGVP